MKAILVLEGGAMRGIYTAGVLDEFMKNNIEVDTTIGVSAGALFGVNYKSKQIGRCLKYNLDYLKDKNYMGYYSFLKTGNIMNKETCFHKILYESHPFDFKEFKKNKMNFYAVVTNVETGEAEYKKIEDAEKDIEYLRASASMPFVSKLVEVDGRKYLDGAIKDSVPVKWALNEGYDKIIIVETQPKEYRKQKPKIGLLKWKYRKYPKFLNAFLNRYKIYNETKEYIEQLEKEKKVFVIRPSKTIPIKRLEKNKDIVLEMYELGKQDFKEKQKELQDYLNKYNNLEEDLT